MDIKKAHYKHRENQEYKQKKAPSTVKSHIWPWKDSTEEAEKCLKLSKKSSGNQTYYKKERHSDKKYNSSVFVKYIFPTLFTYTIVRSSKYHIKRNTTVSNLNNLYKLKKHVIHFPLHY